MEPGGESLWRKAGLKMTQANLFAALRAAFPAHLDSAAVETDHGLVYSWRDLDRASAMLANWLGSLDLPLGSRFAVQVD
jgi:malonyl-CoA/methylmalonyl-CoA synthetase